MTYVAIEMSDREARCLWFKPRLSLGAQVLTEANFDRIPFPDGVIRHGVLQDVEVFSQVLQKARLTHREIGTTRVLLALPWELGIIRTHQLPWFPANRRAQALHYVIEDDMPMPDGNIAYAYRILAQKKQAYLEVLAVAVRRSTLEDYALAFKQAGFELERAELSATVLAERLPLNEGEDGLCLYRDGPVLNLAWFQGLKPILVRTLEGDIAGGADHEFVRLLHYLSTQHPEFNLQRLWCLGLDTSEDVKGILEHLGSSVSLEEVPLAEKRSQTVCHRAPIALAMAGQVVRHRGLNLWPSASASRRKRRLKHGIALVLGAAFLLESLIWIPLQQQVKALEQELAEHRAEVGKRQGEKERETALLQRWDEIGTSSWKTGDLLTQVERELGSGTKLESLELKQGLLYLRATAKEANQVEVLMRQLTSLGWEKPALAAYTQEGQGRIVFAVTAQYASVKKQ